MKKLVPLGEFALLTTLKVKTKKGDLIVADGANGDIKYTVINFGSEADTELEIGDIVFVRPVDLTPIKTEDKREFFITKFSNIMAYEEK